MTVVEGPALERVHDVVDTLVHADALHDGGPVAHDHPRLDIDREEHGPLVALELVAQFVGRGGVGWAVGAGAVPEATGDAALEHDTVVDWDLLDRHDGGTDRSGIQGLLNVSPQVGLELALRACRRMLGAA